MQAMISAVFTRLRHLPSTAEEDLLAASAAAATAMSRTPSTADLDSVAADRPAPAGPRMAAPDPSSFDVPAAGTAQATGETEATEESSQQLQQDQDGLDAAEGACRLAMLPQHSRLTKLIP